MGPPVLKLRAPQRPVLRGYCAEAKGFLQVSRWFGAIGLFLRQSIAIKIARRRGIGAAIAGEAGPGPVLLPRGTGQSSIPESLTRGPQSPLPSSSQLSTQTHPRLWSPARSPTAGSPARGREGLRVHPEGSPGLTSCQGSKTTGSNAQLVTTENSGRGQTQCRKQDRIQVPRPPAMAGAPPCSQYPSHCWSHPGTQGPSPSATPAAPCRRAGRGRTPGQWPPRQPHPWVPAPPQVPRSVTDACGCVLLTVKLGRRCSFSQMLSGLSLVHGAWGEAVGRGWPAGRE